MSALAGWTLEPPCRCSCSERYSLHFCCWISGAGEWLCRFFRIQKLLWRRGLFTSWIQPWRECQFRIRWWLCRLTVVDVAIKSFTVYAPNITVEKRSFFRRLGPFLDDPKQLVLTGDWNASLELKIDKDRRRARGSDRCESSLIDLLAVHDLIDRFRLDHTGREMWTWLNNSPSGWIRCNLGRVLGESTSNSFLVTCSTR